MQWVLKSESDTDRVYVQIDRHGAETGQFRYELDGQEPIHVTQAPAPVVKHKRSVPAWAPALLFVAVVEGTRLVFG